MHYALKHIIVIGFIDYIVLPTLTVLGDGLDLILGTLNIQSNAKQQASVSEDSSGATASGIGGNILHRPWTDILTENRERWQKKHDAGNFLSNGLNHLV